MRHVIKTGYHVTVTLGGGLNIQILTKGVEDGKRDQRRNKWWSHPYTNFKVKGIERQGKEGW